jgi:hypothetical protein
MGKRRRGVFYIGHSFDFAPVKLIYTYRSSRVGRPRPKGSNNTGFYGKQPADS